MTDVQRMLHAILTCGAALLLASCGGSTADPPRPHDSADAASPPAPRASVSGRYTPPKSGSARRLIDLRAAVSGSASNIDFEYDLAEFLPHQLFSINHAPAEPASAGILIGTITAVDPGQGYAVLDADGQPARDADAGTPVAFDDPRSVWRVVVVTMDVGRLLAARPVGGCSPDARKRCTVRFGYAVYGDDPEPEMAGLLGLHDAVVVLDPDKTYGDIAPGLRAVARGGALLGDIDDHGFVGFPALAEENSAFVGSLDTVNAIVTAAARPAPPVIPVTVDTEGTVKRALPGN